MRTVKTWLKYAAAIAGGSFLIIGSNSYWQNSLAFMPSEYKTLQATVNRLASKNDLGDQIITFSITSGSKTRWNAEELNLCTKDDCYFYRELNPFKPYLGKSAEDVNEAIRQAYLFNGIEAYAWSHGVITVSRSTFQSYEGKREFFSCLISHELSHFLNNDAFKDSLREGQEGKNLKEEKRELLKNQISRESESNADINATKMVMNLGLPKETCLKAYDFYAKHEGRGGETKKDSSHPGYVDRYAAIENFLKTYKPNPDKTIEETKGKWKYNRDLNTLVFTPE